MRVRVLGAHSVESKHTALLSFLIDEVLAVEAGSLTSELKFPEQARIRAILLSHGHYDHIRGIPSFLFGNTDRLTRVLGLPHTLDLLSSHLMDGIIYPDFADGNSFLKRPVVELTRLEPFQVVNVEGYRILAVPVSHAVPAVGFEITSGDGRSLFYSGDCGHGFADLWQHVNPDLLLMDTTFPNRLRQFAEDSGHLCPELLAGELAEFRRLKGYLPRVFVIHLNPRHEPEIRKELAVVASDLDATIQPSFEGQEIEV